MSNRCPHCNGRIYTVLERADEYSPIKSSRRKIDFKKAKAMRAKGETFISIARRFGVTKQAVSYMLKYYQNKT